MALLSLSTTQRDVAATPAVTTTTYTNGETIGLRGVVVQWSHPQTLAKVPRARGLALEGLCVAGTIGVVGGGCMPV